MQRAASLPLRQRGAIIAQPTAGSKKRPVVLLSTASVKSRPIAAEAATGLRNPGRRTARFRAARTNAVSVGSRMASRLKQ